MKKMKQAPWLLLLLLLLPVGWIVYTYLLPDPVLSSPIRSVTPEQAGLVWRECELPIPGQASDPTARDESVACFGHPVPMLAEDEKSNSGQFVDTSHVRMSIGQDRYDARAYDLIALTVYSLYKNGAPVRSLVGPGDTPWLRMFLSNVDGRVAWGIANGNPATIVYDGKDLRNVYGLDKAHAAYGLAGKLIFVAQKEGQYFVMYDGQKVGPDYDRITIGYCCETALYTARGGQGRYQFRGMRSNKNYIVEISAAQMPGEERDQARSSLQAFFSFLHDGRYREAVRFYGGDYQTLRDDNPEVAPDDYALLLERACRQNGFMCLEVRAIVEQIPVSATMVRFTVEFATAEGKLFVRGPCCGATKAEMPSLSRFDYTVKKVGDSFLVQELPVYVP